METIKQAAADQPSRRTFLKSSAAMGAGLSIGFVLPLSDALAAAKQDPLVPNAWVRVYPDNTIKLVVHKHDSGTGTHTSLGSVLAEELEVDLSQVQIITPEHPFFKAYIHPLWHVFSTGGSTSVMLEYDSFRKAGATAKTMLVQAAANRWKVAPEACRADRGYVLHGSTGRKASYGALAEDAAKLEAPKEVKLKDPKDFRMIGKLTHKLNAREKVTGRLKYSIDLKRPGMLVAVIKRSPVIHGRVISFDASAALAIPGVRQVLKVPAAPASVLGGNQEGVAVLADDYWSAKKGREALKITWDEGKFASFNSADLPKQQAAYLNQPGILVVPTMRTGNADEALKKSATKLTAEYTMPYKVPSPLEPQCVLVEVKDGKVAFWGGLQVPSYALEAAQVLAGASADQVQLNEVLSGGSFGAREAKYWLFEAVYLAKTSGLPIKLLNSREDEVQALFYHPASYHKLSGGLDAKGQLSAFQLRTVGPASPEEWEPGYDERKDKMDYSTTEAISKYDFAYRPEHLDLAWVRHETGVPTGWFRAVSFIPNVFAVESFMDELAHAGGKDPLAFRKAVLQDKPRHLAVLEMAAQKAGWGKPLPAGRSLGLATNQAYNSFIAIVVEVEKTADKIEVRRITCVADCGLAVHPGSVREQIYGGLMWGLGHALYDRIDIENGRVKQSNFADAPVMRMSDMPQIDITIVEGNRDKPSGVGELSNPGVTPAIANALFALTGKRQRSTPLDFSV